METDCINRNVAIHEIIVGQWIEKIINNQCTVRDMIAAIPADVVPAPRWIPVTERLPKEGEYVMIFVGECQVARLEKGISAEERSRMVQGIIDDPIVGYSDWDKRPVKRSDVFKRCDEQGNNKVSYIWIANGGPMQWFGQDATHWMPLPEPPKEGGGENE